jgi:hypothetical protein
LLAIRGSEAIRACYVSYISGTRIRISSWSPTGSAVDSAEVSYDPKRSHEIEFTAGEYADPNLNFDVGCRFDGVPFFGLDRATTPGRPAVVVSAYNSAGAPGVENRFTGPRMDLSLVRDAALAAAEENFGPIHMLVLFPAGKMGRHEPLLTTGRAGSGDLVYIVYEDEGHVRIGYDHWSAGAALSDPVAIDYKVPHEMWISIASLYPASGSDSHSAATVILDGNRVLSSAMVAFPTLPAEITIGQNRIGGSTADPDFSGVVQFLERTGAAPLPSSKP